MQVPSKWRDNYLFPVIMQDSLIRRSLFLDGQRQQKLEKPVSPPSIPEKTLTRKKHLLPNILVKNKKIANNILKFLHSFIKNNYQQKLN